MNRSILIVICDFLLLSLLAFSTVDINQVANNTAAAPKMSLDIAANRAESRQDLALVMRTALEEERRNRDQLMGELTRSRQTVGTQQGLLAERQQQLESAQQQLHSKEQQTAQLEQEYASAQTNLQSLGAQLQSSSTEALLSKEKLAALQAELQKQAQLAAALKEQLAEMGRSNQTVLLEKVQLAGKLQVAQAEERAAAEKAARMTEEVKVERAEKAKLAEGVTALAAKSSQLAEEIRTTRPMPANAIFNQFVTNRVGASFSGVRAGIFGSDWTRHKETETVLATDGTNVFAICHVQDSPMTFWNPGTDWEALSGTLATSQAQVPMSALSFCLQDPRVVLLPVTRDQAKQLGCKVYQIASDPFKFQDAVLIGAREGYYGECKFEIDLSTPEYVKLDRNVIKGLFGKFNPSRGDLVFSKTGELLGVMANSTYCMIMRSFDAAATFKFGSDLRAQHTAQTLASLFAVISDLPYKLQ